jgi:hypothetical protein
MIELEQGLTPSTIVVRRQGINDHAKKDNERKWEKDQRMN